MSDFDVSVIIPTFDRLWALPRAVESCRGSRCRTEIIVVDDGSTDGTWEWLSSQAEVVALRHPRNLGQTWASNLALSVARGEYVRFLDSDDRLCPGANDRQLDAARRTGAQLVYSRVDEELMPSGRVVESPDPPLWDDFMAVQLGEGYGSLFTGMLFHRDLITRVPRRPEFALRDDRMLLLEVALLGPTLAAVPGCAAYWTKHASQMHDSFTGIKAVVANWQYVEIYRRVLAELEARGELTERRKRAAAPMLWQLAHAVAAADLDYAADVAAWAAALDPTLAPRAPAPLGVAYRVLGFRATERLLRLRRSMLAPFRSGGARRHGYFPGAA